MSARTPDMLAAELGYSRAQIYAMIKRNEIGYVKRRAAAVAASGGAPTATLRLQRQIPLR